MLDDRIPLTWRSIARIGLIAAAEAAVLALVEDSTLAVKVATGAIALLGLGVLEFETKIKAIKPFLFGTSITILVVAYLGFVGYAISHAIHEISVSYRLDDLYNRGVALKDRPFSGPLNAFELMDWQNGTGIWRDETVRFLQSDVGEFAKDKFLNVTGKNSYTYGNTSSEVNLQINQMNWLLGNLEEIRRNRGQK